MDPITVYADFITPECYLASRRVDVLRAGGFAVDWRAVEVDRTVPVTGRRLDPAEQDALAERFAALEALLAPDERLPHLIPAVRPKTEAAVTAVAEAYGTPAADDVRRVLMELYWCEGADIGSPGALRTPLAGPILRTRAKSDPLRYSGFAVSVDRGPMTTAAWHRIRDWQATWRAFGASPLPVVLIGGATLVGADAIERLGKEALAAHAAHRPTDDPRRYPAERVRPEPHWLSWVGGRWRNGYRLPPR